MTAVYTIIALAVVAGMVWLTAPLHDPNDTSLSDRMRGGPP
jgi:hypothetical protein